MPSGPESMGGSPILIDSNEQSTTTKKFPNLLTAVSQIQRYAMFERKGGEIPVDFLTLDGQFSFFNVGMASGLVHGLFFYYFRYSYCLYSQMIFFERGFQQYVSLAEYKSFFSSFPSGGYSRLILWLAILIALRGLRISCATPAAS